MRNPTILLLAGLLVLVTPAGARAQDEDTPTHVVDKQVVSSSPLLLRFGYLNGEYERRIGPTSTWGVSALYSHHDGRDFTDVNLMLRYYPRGAALVGFYVGGTAGVYRDAGTRTRVGSHAGYELGYAWLVGPKRNISLNLRAFRPYPWGYMIPISNAWFPRANVGMFTVGFAF
jgi:hypothetical protein